MTRKRPSKKPEKREKFVALARGLGVDDGEELFAAKTRAYSTAKSRKEGSIA
jgi:hypothetical protein